jgi:hypothetical protein
VPVKQVLDRLQAADDYQRAIHEKEPVTVWGPDGGDLFEQMSRPVQSRVADLLKPVHAELQELRSIACRPHSPSHSYLPTSPSTPGRHQADSSARLVDSSSPSKNLLGDTLSAARADVHESIGWLSRRSSPRVQIGLPGNFKDGDEGAPHSPLRAWAQDLQGPLKSPLMQLAAWVEPSSSISQERKSTRPDVPYLDAGSVSSSIQERGEFHVNDSSAGQDGNYSPVSPRRRNKSNRQRSETPGAGAETRGRSVCASPAPMNDVVLLVRPVRASASSLRTAANDPSTPGARGLGRGDRRRQPQQLAPAKTSEDHIRDAPSGDRSGDQGLGGPSRIVSPEDIGLDAPQHASSALITTRPAALNSPWATASIANAAHRTSSGGIEARNGTAPNAAGNRNRGSGKDRRSLNSGDGGRGGQGTRGDDGGVGPEASSG